MIPREVREMLEMRLEINKAGTKKLDAMARNRGRAGRAMFQNRYHGAQTGRQTATGFGDLNMKKPWEDVKPEDLVRDIMYGRADFLGAIYGDPIEAVSRATRHWIKAEPGHRIMAGDFTSIEAVILACLAGEDWKVQAFRDKAKIYELMGDKIYGLAPGTVTKKTHPGERADGKIGELAFGYQGALGAWLKFASAKQDTDCFTPAAKRAMHSDERILEINKAWRGEHPMTTGLWRGLEDVSIAAVQSPGTTTRYRDIGFQVVDEWLSMILPNDKRIWYREPELRMGMPAWHQPETKPECGDGSCTCKPRVKLTYKAQKAGQWTRVSTYGGKLTENACQATAREYLRPSVQAVEDAGYPVILTVYDEVVAEPTDDFGSEDEFKTLLRDAPGREWANGWPIDVDVWAGKVYTK